MTFAICETLSRPTRSIIEGTGEPMAGFTDSLLTLGKKSTAALADLQAMRDAEKMIEPEIAQALADDRSDLAVVGDRLAGLRARRDISTARRLRQRERALTAIVGDVKSAYTKADEARVEARREALKIERAWRAEIHASYKLRADRDRAEQAPFPDGPRMAWNRDGELTDKAWALGTLRSAIDPASIIDRRSRDTSSVMLRGDRPTLTPVQEALSIAARFWPALAD